MANENSTKSKTRKIGLGSFLGYLMSFLLIPAGIISMFTGTFTFGVSVILSGIVAFPPFWVFIKSKYNIEVSRTLKVMLFLIVFSVGAGMSTADREEILQTPPSASVVQETNTESVQPIQVKPIKLSGTGQQATEMFYLDSGLKRFELTASGGGYFGIWLLDSEGNNVDLLVNEIAPFDGSKAVRINRSGNYLLDISANGNWTVSIK